LTSLADNVARWIGRVELVARGADDDRREAERCLGTDRALEARVYALALLAKVPGSPIGLALLVDACEQAGLVQEAARALGELCAAAPWRAELWVQLGEALQRSQAPASEQRAAYQRALESDTDRLVRRQALLKLADLDLAQGDPWRAHRWLDGLRLQSDCSDVALRRLEIAIALGDRDGVESLLADVGVPDALDPRATLITARAKALIGDTSALDGLLRAHILDAPGAGYSLASYVAQCRNAAEIARVRQVLAAQGCDGEPGFALALALAEGRTADAQAALMQIAKSGDPHAARSLYDIALQRCDEVALGAAIEVLADACPAEGRALLQATKDASHGAEDGALAQLDSLSSGDAATRPWAHRLRIAIMRGWAQADDPDRFGLVLAELRRAAASLDRLDLMTVCEQLSVERGRPLRVAIVGEFNAGKSTFINALIGADVAPTGILPTTATLHWLAWAPDPFVRVVLSDGPDRVVTHQALKNTLRQIYDAGEGHVREVHICAPIERLKRIELLDTPGFNAPQAEHADAAQRAIEQAHVVLWVVDAAQPLKDSERSVLGAIAARGVPVQLLVNKCDRLAPGQAASVLAHVGASLQSLGVSSIGPVLGLSAREALTGRLGDSQALQRSGWSEVEQLLASVIVNRSEQLRRAALHRKARAVAVDLLGIATRPADARTQQPAGEAGEQQRQRVGRWLSLDQPACERIVAELEGPLQQLLDDLRPLQVASGSSDQSTARAYAEARRVARLTEPIVRGLLREADLQGQMSEPVRSAVTAVLRGASAVEPMQAPGWREVHACALAAHEAAIRLLSEANQSRAGSASAARLARLAALSEALATG
jgi:cellulose synthase operon protein C